MNRTRRILLLAAAGVVGILLLAIGALVFFFPAERVGRLAADRASEALGRDVTVERIRLGILPMPAVVLEGVVIGPLRDTGASAASVGRSDLARIARVEARPRLLSLLGGRVQIHSFVVDRPEITVDAADLAPRDTLPEEDDAPGFWDDATFQVRDIRVSNGVLAYRDATTGTQVRASGFDQNLSFEGEMSGGELVRMLLRGGFSVDSLALEMPEQLAMPINGLRLAVEHDATLDLGSEVATIDRLAVRLAQLELQGSGVLRSWSDEASRSISLSLTSASDDVGALIASLPPKLRTIGFGATGERELRGSGGAARIEATVEGPFGPGVMPEVDGALELTSLSIAAASDPLVEDLTGRITFSMDSVVASDLAGRLLGQPVRVAAVVNDLSAPAIRAAIAGGIDLGRATSFGLLPSGTTAGGTLGIDMSVIGPLEEPAGLQLDGTVDLAGITFATDSLPAPVNVAGGVVQLTGQEVVARDVRATIGRSDFRVDAAGTGIIPYALGDSTVRPQVLLETRSAFIDADALFPPDPNVPTYAELFFARLTGRPVAGMTAAEAAEAAGFRLPELPRMAIEGRFQADRISQRGHEFEQVDVSFAGIDGQLELREATFGLMGGGVELAAVLGTPQEGPGGGRLAPVRVSLQLDGVESSDFLTRFTPLRQHLNGALELAGAMTMQLDEHLLPVPETLAGSGSLSLLDGRLVGWPLLRAFGEQLGLATFDTIAVRDWSGQFQMLGSRFVLEETSVAADRMDLALGGWFDVSGALELGATAYLDPSFAAMARGGVASTLARHASDSQGRIPIGVRITGTTTQPTVRLDLSSTGAQVAARVREEAEQQARDLARSLAEQAASRIPGADSLTIGDTPGAIADTVRQRVQDAVVGRLRGLLGGGDQAGGGAAPATPPADTAVSIPAPVDTAADVDTAAAGAEAP